MSWVCPPPFFVSGSWVDPVACVFADGFRHLWAVALAERRLPMRWAPPEPMGLAVAPPISPSAGPGQSPHFAVRPWSSGRCFMLFLRDVLQVFIAIKFVSFTDLCVSRHTRSLRAVFIGHLQRRVTGLTYGPPPRSSRTLSIALTYGYKSLFLMHPVIDIVWRWPCLPRLRLLWPLAITVLLVVFTSWLAPSIIPHRDVCLDLPAMDACRVEGLGWLTVPLLSLPGQCR